MDKKTYMQRMSYDSFRYAIKKARSKSNVDVFTLAIELFTGYLIHGADFIDYAMMGFWELSYREKKTYLTHERNDELIMKYNDDTYLSLLTDRKLFNEKFSNYLKRDSFIIDGDNYSQFLDFIKDKDEVFAKPILKNGKRKVRKVNLVNSENKEDLYSYLYRNHLVVLEDKVKVHSHLSKLVMDGYVDIHFMTLYKNEDSFLINSVLKLENKDIIVSPIDFDSGKVLYPACDSELNIYKVTPFTNQVIEGVEIPFYEEAKQMVLSAAKELPKVCYVDWKVLIGEDGPVLISATPKPNYAYYQFPIHASRTGLMPIIEEIEK